MYLASTILDEREANQVLWVRTLHDTKPPLDNLLIEQQESTGIGGLLAADVIEFALIMITLGDVFVRCVITTRHVCHVYQTLRPERLLVKSAHTLASQRWRQS